MKKICMIFALAAILFACEEKEIPFYEGTTYLSFVTDISQDSTEVSFFFYPGEDKLDIPVEISLAGKLFDEDIPVRLTVVDSLSDAMENSYSLPENSVFRAGQVTDTLIVTLHKTPELEEASYHLVLALEETSDYFLGQKEYRNNKIIFTAKASRPEWWDATITNVYLGNYTQTKFELFMEVTGVGDLDGLSSSEIRALALKFKRYLKAQNPPIKDEDGNDMSVTVIGE